MVTFVGNIMKQYIIVEGTLEDLEARVNDKIKLGYFPIGGITAKSFNYGQPFSFIQAMILRGEHEQ